MVAAAPPAGVASLKAPSSPCSWSWTPLPLARTMSRRKSWFQSTVGGRGCRHASRPARAATASAPGGPSASRAERRARCRPAPVARLAGCERDETIERRRDQLRGRPHRRQALRERRHAREDVAQQRRRRARRRETVTPPWPAAAPPAAPAPPSGHPSACIATRDTESSRRAASRHLRGQPRPLEQHRQVRRRPRHELVVERRGLARLPRGCPCAAVRRPGRSAPASPRSSSDTARRSRATASSRLPARHLHAAGEHGDVHVGGRQRQRALDRHAPRRRARRAAAARDRGWPTPPALRARAPVAAVNCWRASSSRPTSSAARP